MEIILAVLSFLGPVFKYFLEWLFNRGKVSDQAKANLESAYKIIVDKRERDAKRIKKLEDRLDKEHKKMDDILAGKRKYAWQKDKVEAPKNEKL